MQKLLSAAGIPSFFGHDNIEGIESFHGSFERGVDLKVDSSDEATANLLIAGTRDNSAAEVEEDQEKDAEDEVDFDKFQF